jgi:hypothetical protein
MAIVWVDGFESYGASGDPNPLLARRYANVGGAYANWSVIAGRAGGHALAANSVGSELWTPSLTTNSTLIVAFAFLLPTPPSGAQIMAIYDGQTVGILLEQTAAGELTLRYPGAGVATTSGLGLCANVWWFVELKVVCGSAGSYELRVNGATALSASGINTQVGYDAYYNCVALWGCAGATPHFDDLVIMDGTGGVNNDFLGDCAIVAMLPAGAGDVTQWTPSSGANYACVNENPPDDNASYVQASASGAKDLYAYSGVTSGGVIHGIQISTDARSSDLSGPILKTLAKSGGVESDDAGQTVPNADYLTLMRVMQTDPSGNPWTQASLNAAQFGVGVG